MLTISRRNSTRFANSKKSCDERSRIYDVRRKIQSVVEQKNIEGRKNPDAHENHALHVHHVVFHPYPQYPQYVK